MSRQASLRQKGKYWASFINGETKRFGRVDEVSQADATKRFREYLASIGGPAERSPTITLDQLAERFLVWVAANRGKKAHAERSRHIDRFRKSAGKIEAGDVTSAHIEKFVGYLRASEFAADYVEKHLVSVKAMFRKGVRKGWIPATVRPFDAVDAIRREPKALVEDKLPTRSEVARLIEAADGIDRDMIGLFYATGARTGEIAAARAGDFQRANRQIILAKHKRSYTLRQATPRVITLNDEATEILTRLTADLPPEAILFPMPRDGKPHSNYSMGERFRRVRKRAGVRNTITIYSLRHLWISDALAAGIDAMLVARMAGTGLKMIESVYGHYRSQNLHDAQARIDASRS